MDICSHKEECNVIWLLWVEHVSPTKIHGPVAQLYGKGVVRPQNGRKWCKVFKSGQAEIMMVTSADPANKEELILEDL
jgi:hypothetical protein